MSDEKASESENEIHSFRVLYGADYVKQILLHALALGTPSIESSAYLIKARVKDVQSLITKVDERQKNDKSYCAATARDIVGLRLLTLFRSELPLLVSRFLNFVEWAQAEPFNLFVGKKLLDAIEEVIIYTTDAEDPNTAIVLQQFTGRGIPLGDEKSPKPNIRIERKQTRYSSIHIVLWAYGPKKSDAGRIPIEVQIRTSLEDVWGEIDHRLRYKARSAGAAEQPTPNERTSKQLRTLKSQLDAVTEAADIIAEDLIGVIANSENSVQKSKDYVSYDFDQLRNLGLDRKIQQQLNELVDKLFVVYRAIHGLREPARADLLDRWLGEFAISESAFETLYRLYLEHPFPSSERDSTIRYRLLMERALCLYWQAIILKTKAFGRAEKGDEDPQARSKINASISLYYEIAKIEGRENDVVLRYRIANALEQLGQRELALNELKKAVEALPADKTLSKNHYMRLRIPRQYGFALWEAAERIKISSGAFEASSLLLERRRAYYLEALDLTATVYGMAITEGAVDRSTESSEQENRITANNLVEYVFSFLKAGGNGEELNKRGMTVQKVKDLLKEMLPDGVESAPRVTVADTYRECMRWLGDRPQAIAGAERVLKKIGHRDFNVPLSDFAFDEMHKDALQELQYGLGPVPGYPRLW